MGTTQALSYQWNHRYFTSTWGMGYPTFKLVPAEEAANLDSAAVADIDAASNVPKSF